jgi:DNA-binding response OmpR family regulator
MKILLVDDDADQREIRALLLTQAGFDTIEAGTPSSAKAIATTERPNAAVIDLRLPTIDHGLALIRDLKVLDPTMRLIVLTGARADVLKTRPERHLVDRLLVKPASTGALIEMLRSGIQEAQKSVTPLG